MKPWLRSCVLVLSLTSLALAQEERFSRVLPAGEFAAAGLARLSPEELARLDALVRDYKSGALAAAQRELAAAEAKAAGAREAQAAAEARAAEATAAAKRAQTAAAPAEDKKPSLIERAKVLLRPGTKIEYTTLESRLATEFNGWERNTVFTLENGQRWRVVGGSAYITSPMPAPNVKIEPGALGSFWMVIEGVRQRVRVEPFEAK